MISKNVIFWDVDTQVDFMLPGGKLYVPGAEKIIPNLKRLVDAARQRRVFLVSDACSHTLEDEEFKEWPPHCVRGTPGQEKIPETVLPEMFVIPNQRDVRLPENLLSYQQILLEKQTLNVFDNPHTDPVVKKLEKDFQPAKPEFAVFGVVTEYCVRLAASGLLERGYRVALVTDAIETLKAADGQRTLSELTGRGARLITTDQALALL